MIGSIGTGNKFLQTLKPSSILQGEHNIGRLGISRYQKDKWPNLCSLHIPEKKEDLKQLSLALI